MSGVKGNRNALGNSGGKSLQDRKLAAEVRGLTLVKIKTVLENPKKDRDLYRAVLLRLAGSILPRLNETTGEDGGPVRINLTDEQRVKLGKRMLKRMIENDQLDLKEFIKQPS